MLLSKSFNHYFISSWHFTIFRATFSLCVNYFSFFATTLWMNWKFAIHFNSVSMCHFVVLSLKNMIYFRGWIPMAENDQTGVSFPTLILCSKARLADIIYMNIYVVYIVIYLCELKFVFMVPIHNKSKLVWFRWDGRGISYPNPMTHINTIKLIGGGTYHYGDVIMGAIASQITSFTIVYSTVYSDADQRKHQSLLDG